ncbi:hypothetical protein ACIPRU_05450, partial [Streptomyces sp. NPDC090126]|uniref:hypothetical protein n=1 Tax=Streptomyces sp. NPDC090126 TaxID=3365952 RepID=UPI0037F5E3B3
MHRAQSGQERPLLGTILAQQRNNNRASGTGTGQALTRKTRERPVRTQLHERRHTQTGQRT